MKTLHDWPEPNPRTGPLTTTEYELVEFDMTMTGQRAAYCAVVRNITQTADRLREDRLARQQAAIERASAPAPAPEPAAPPAPAPDLARSAWQIVSLIVICWSLVGLILLALAIVKGAGIE